MAGKGESIDKRQDGRREGRYIIDRVIVRTMPKRRGFFCYVLNTAIDPRFGTERKIFFFSLSRS